MTDPARAEVPLSPEDAQRMRRLSEEVRGRLTEMSLILTRTLGTDFGEAPRLHFLPEPQKVFAKYPGGQHIQLVCTPDGSQCGCYVDPPGICVQGNPSTGC